MEAEASTPGMALRRSRPFADELGDAGGLLESVAGEGHFHGEDVVRVEAGIDVAQGEEGADEQRGADEQDEGERDFADDEQGARFALAESGAGAVAAFLERGVEVGARGADGGEESEEDAGEQGDAEGEGEDTPIDADGGSVFADAGDVAGAESQQRAHADVAEDETENAAGDGEQDAFGEQLADDAARVRRPWQRGWRTRACGQWRGRGAGWRHWRRR